MAGRPTRMAERVAKLEVRAFELQEDLRRAAPQQYLERSSCGTDPLGLCAAWNNAVETSEDAYYAVEELADILRDRAGIDKWAPSETQETLTPADPEPGKPETTETPQAAEREPDDTPHSADTRSGRAQGGAQPKPG